MSVLISGVLINPAGEPIPDAEITFTALTTSDSVLNGFSASVMTNDDGEYSIPLEHCVYSISIQSDGYNSVYGSVSITEKSTPATINELLKLATMEQAVTPAIIVYFREIQADVAAKLATMQSLNNTAATASRDAVAAKNAAAQYAQNLSAAVAQAQQASAAATASSNAATSAKNAAEAAATNAKNTLSDTMTKSANGADIPNPAAFRNNIGLGTGAVSDVQVSSFDATANRILKNGAWGWGGSGQEFYNQPNGDTLTYLRGDNTPSNIFRFGFVNPYGIMNAASIYSRVRDSWSMISVGPSPSPTNSASGVRVSAGYSTSNQAAIYDVWTNVNLSSPATTDTTQTITGEKLFTRSIAINPKNSSSVGIEIGSTESPTPTQSYLDFHSSGNNIDYDARIIASGGSTAVGRGRLDITAAEFKWNNCNVATLERTELFTGAKSFASSPSVTANNAGLNMESLQISESSIGRWVQMINTGNSFGFYIRAGANGNAVATGGRWVSMPTASAGTILVSNNNATVDANGFYKTASPVINIYADGSFTTTDEAAGVDVERLEEGVYKITGCIGLNADRAWGGDDGGITNPKCRNGYERIWNDYDVQEDGSLIIRTYHRVHSDAMPFAQNRLNLDHRPYNEKRDSEEWADRSPIDIPLGTYLTVRVQMPAREEEQYVPVTRAISHSNVYCNSVSSA
ncbi:prophage tail fiber N-terminal domain-containing protein [Pectobacterium sp. LFLA-215]|uniref:phage tail fiber protein n=1 Tax=Pectobacterium sp. LFLA-215 TaxID=3419008 RepID=UPI003F5CAB1A